MIKTQPKIFTSLATLIMLLMLPFGVQASEQYEVGKVERIQGAATATVGENTRPLAIGDTVFAKEIIKTTTESRIRLRMIDDGEITLGGETVFIVADYGLTPDTNTGKVLLNLLEGAVRSTSGSLNKTKNASYKLRTPLATIGVRGTEYWGGYLSGNHGHGHAHDHGDTPKKFGVLMISGKGVDITTNNGAKASLLEPGDGVWIMPNTGMMKPKDKWTKEQLDSATKATGFAE